MAFYFRILTSVLFAALLCACADNRALKGVTLIIDTTGIEQSDFSQALISDISNTFRGNGMLITTATTADYRLIILDAYDYEREGDDVTVYESCTDCTTGEEVFYDDFTTTLYYEGYEVNCKIIDSKGITILNQIIGDEASDKVRDFKRDNCSASNEQCEGTEVGRALLSALDPGSKVSRIVMRAIRRNE